MKNLQESIRKKLTSKYVDKANKVIKITENLEKVSDDFYEGNYNSFFDRMFVLSESYRNSKMFLTESTEGSFEVAFTKLFKGDEEKVKQKLVNYVSSQLKLTQEMKNYLDEEMRNIDASEISKYFTDPSKLTELIANAVVESAKTADSEEDIMSIAQNVAIPYLNTLEFKETLKKKLKEKVSQKVDDVKLKVEDMLRKVIKAVAEKKD
jgi:hypothetical protein